MGKHCKDCAFFQTAYRSQFINMPEWCGRHAIAVAHDDPACPSFHDKDDKP